MGEGGRGRRWAREGGRGREGERGGGWDERRGVASGESLRKMRLENSAREGEEDGERKGWAGWLRRRDARERARSRADWGGGAFVRRTPAERGGAVEGAKVGGCESGAREGGRRTVAGEGGGGGWQGALQAERRLPGTLKAGSREREGHMIATAEPTHRMGQA